MQDQQNPQKGLLMEDHDNMGASLATTSLLYTQTKYNGVTTNTLITTSNHKQPTPNQLDYSHSSNTLWNVAADHTSSGAPISFAPNTEYYYPLLIFIDFQRVWLENHFNLCRLEGLK